MVKGVKIELQVDKTVPPKFLKPEELLLLKKARSRVSLNP